MNRSHLNLNYSALPLIFLGFSSIIFYYIIDKGFSNLVIVVNLAFVYLAIFYCYQANNKFHNKNFLTPIYLFILFYLVLLILPYQFHLFGLGDVLTNNFLNRLYINQTNHSLTLSTIGLIFFIIGYSSKNQLIKRTKRFEYKYFHIYVGFLFSFLFLIFVVTNLNNYISGAYSGSDNSQRSSNAIYFMLNHFGLIITAILMYRLINKQKLSFMFIIFLSNVMLWCLLLLIMGDRNNLLLYILIIVVGYTTFIKRIKFLYCVVILILGFTIYNIIELNRKFETRSLSSLAIAASSVGDEKGFDITQSSFSLTLITSRAALSAVDSNGGHYYGQFKLIGLMGVVPFSRESLLGSVQFTDTAQVITHEVLGPDSDWSLGSNLISDLYIDFGIIGVIAGMLLFGIFLKHITLIALSNTSSFTAIVFYLILAALFIELPRYSISFTFRNSIWLLLMFASYKFFYRSIIPFINK